ncbi:YCF48-related protein [Galbibacter sp. EGI 63066]|uniref:T9SS type A sorting domain-containing protein n=1 Tax=Galbibacter sp. EGI 63066 TaxID=2993559 RepID=UPI0022497897|nr:YCF48-related protein [Galbibacter sp. EGI 63066]MCX2681870.1 YCF48-related protein [Galbibacter sp. EGI 63066]
MKKKYFILLIGLAGLGCFNLNAQQEVTCGEWEKLNVGFDYIFRGIEFPEDQNDIAYAAGESLTYNGDGIVIKTIDGGDTWSQIWFGEDQGLKGISFPTLNTGYVAGWGDYFAKTTDGGATWQQQTPISDVFFYRNMVFKDENNGVITAQTTTGSAVYWTNDGGQTWAEGTGLASVPYQITYVSGDTYFIVTNGGQIQKSIDNGASWTTVFTGTPESLIGIEFYDDMVGVATGDDGVIYKTADGGTTWESQTVGEGSELWRDIAWEDDANKLTLVGTPEQIYESEDGGQTWPIDNTDVSDYYSALYEVLYTSNGTGYIIGSQGVFFRKKCETTLNIDSNLFGQDLSIYPNPMRDILNLRSSTFDIEKVIVHDVLGKQVATILIDDRFASIDLSSLKPGIYLLKISAINTTVIRKVIKK